MALAYRTLAHELDPARCGALDAMLTAWGQTWVAPRSACYDVDAWIPAREAADMLAVKLGALRMLRTRGRIHGRRVGTSFEYLTADVLRLATSRRGKGGSDDARRSR